MGIELLKKSLSIRISVQPLYSKLTVLLILLNTTVVFSQDKRDYQWFFGSNQAEYPEFRAFQFDFNTVPFKPALRDRGLRFDQNNTSLCDKNGNLLLYSNGCAIANRDHEVMMNGDSINVGEFLEDFWSDGVCGIGYPGHQDMLTLEDPGYEDGYYVIHKRLDRHSDGKFHVLSLSYSYVDMALADGLGGVTEKNVDFYTSDKFLWSYLSALYQPNGKDWWIVNPGADNKFYFFALDDSGIQLSHTQDAEHEFHPFNASASGNARFSPDGLKYAYFNQYDGLLLYDFSRSTGELSNMRKINFPEPDGAKFATCEWSPNSEYIYLATGDSLWQVEVGYEDLKEGREFIAEYNGVKDPFSTRFFTSALGPDCRIYIRPGSSTYSFHVIHQPDKKGIACNFVQQGLKLPEVSSTGSFPNYPRFRVDAEDKCDPTLLSVLGEEVFWRQDLIIYPNPASAFITIEATTDSSGDLYIIDPSGKIVSHHKEVETMDCINVSLLSAGTYIVEFIPSENSEKVVYTYQLIIQN